MSDTEEFMDIQLLKGAGFRDIWAGKRSSYKAHPRAWNTWATRDGWVTVVLPSTIWLAPMNERACEVAREVCNGDEPVSRGFAAHWVPDRKMVEIYEEAAA